MFYIIFAKPTLKPGTWFISISPSKINNTGKFVLCEGLKVLYPSELLWFSSFQTLAKYWVRPLLPKKVREKPRECHNYKPQSFPDTKRKRKQTKRKPNKHTKSSKISSLFPKRDNRNAKRTEKHKNKITQG